jgi:hyaluronoglucosaminidase
VRPALGIVEGFFGPLWSWEERKALVSQLAPAGYTRYLYAPKADAALRRRWNAPYDAAWLDSLARFASDCAKHGVEFGVGLSPYGLQDEHTSSSVASLQWQLKALRSCAVKRIGILFDDMEARADNLARTQSEIVSAATEAIPDASFVVCPSYYSDDIVLDRVFGERPQNYLEDLGRALDPNIEIFWTGPEVCSRQISVSHLERVAEQLRRKPTLWDNYPVNDGPRMSTQLHLRGFTGRDARIADHVSAHMINPALQPTLTAIPALTLADVYAQGDRYDYAESFARAADSVAGQALSTALREDLLAFQDTGSHRLGERKSSLREKYVAFDHPIATEIVAWLDGRCSVSADTVQTQ